ncbi:MAG: hypothetical protein ABS52_16590 [Gemmatimonadetes bacterium SCN 70-22]|nr:MAG: hypothetical protein ABS52_16590 [Gemmatimonadetes bacterium SCN 70-22]
MRETYQLSLLGDPPQKGKPYRPTFWQFRWAGIPWPATDEEQRQMRLMQADTQPTTVEDDHA